MLKNLLPEIPKIAIKVLDNFLWDCKALKAVNQQKYMLSKHEGEAHDCVPAATGQPPQRHLQLVDL